MKRFLQMMTCALACCFCTLFVCCVTTDDKTEPFEISDYYVATGESIDLSDLGLPKNVTLTCDSDCVAIDGLQITGVKQGVAAVVAKAGTVSDGFSVSVIPPYTLSCEDVSLVVGDTIDLSDLVVNPSNLKLSYRVLAGDSVSIDEDGKMTAVSEGISTVSCFVPKGKQILFTAQVVSEATISADDVTVPLGESAVIYASDNLNDGDYVYEIMSGREVIDLDGNRIVTIAKGVAQVRISMRGGAVSKTISVTVKSPEYSIKFESLEVEEDYSVTLRPIFEDKNGNLLQKNYQIFFLGNNGVVAFDEQTNTVTGLQSGTVRVMCTVEGEESVTKTFTVTPRKYSVIADKTSLSLTVGETSKIELTTNPVQSNAEFSYEVSGNAVSVGLDGTVVALNAGKAEIFCYTQGRRGVSVAVEVKEKPILSSQDFTIRLGESAMPAVTDSLDEGGYEYQIVSGSEFVEWRNGAFFGKKTGEATVRISMRNGFVSKDVKAKVIYARYDIRLSPLTVEEDLSVTLCADFVSPIGLTIPKKNYEITLVTQNGVVSYDEQNKTVVGLKSGTAEFLCAVENEETAKFTFVVTKRSYEVVANKQAISLKMDQTAQLAVTTQPLQSNAKISYKVVAGDSVTVDANGKLTPIKVGASEVFCYTEGNRGVTVFVSVGSDVALTAQDLTLRVDESKAISVSDSLGEGGYAYEIVSGSDCIKIQDGLVIGIAEGTAIVRVSMREGTVFSDVTVNVLYAAYKISLAPLTVELDLSVVLRPVFTDANGKHIQKNYEIVLLDNQNVVAFDPSAQSVLALKEGSIELVCSVPNEESKTFTLTVLPRSYQVVAEPKSVTITEGETKRLSVTTNPLQADKTIKYAVMSGDSVTVSADGVITAVKDGVSEVFCYTEGNRGVSVMVEVLPKYVFTAGTVGVAVEDTVQLAYEVQPSTSKVGFLLLSGDEFVSLNDANGTVTGLAIGTAQVKVYSKKNPACFAVITISVNSNMLPIPEGYVRINEALYVSHAPGLYRSGIFVSYFTPYKDAKIYYTTDCSVPTVSSKVFEDSISVYRERTYDYSKTPMMHSVDAKLMWLGDLGVNRNSHHNYINRYQNTGSYPAISIATVLRVIVVKNGETIAQTTGTYLVEDKEYYSNYPIISLSMPFEDWFDGYGAEADAGGNGTALYNNVRHEITKRLNLEFFDGNKSFSVNSQVKIAGGWSQGWPQRTMHLNFNRDENGVKQEAISFGIFGENVLADDGVSLLDEFTRFRLHNSGSCHDGSNNSAIINDVLIHELAKGMTNVSTTEYRPAIVYLNGEYWGYYAMREHYSDAFYKYNYDVKKGDVQYIDNINTIVDGDPVETRAFLDEMNAYLNNNNFALDSVYDEFTSKYIDVESYIDLLIIESYVDNWDFMGNSNNFRMWRVNRYVEGNPYTDGRLRFSLHDVDMCLSTGYTQNNRLAPKGSKYITTNTDSSYCNYIMTQKLMHSEKFRTALYNRIDYIANTVFAYDRVKAKLDELYEELLPLWSDSQTRWAWNTGLSQIRSKMDSQILGFIKNRYAWYDKTSREILGILDESADDNKGVTFTCDQYFEGNGSLSPYQVRDFSYTNFELTYTHINNGIGTVSGSYQYHLKFYTGFSNAEQTQGNNYVMRVLRNMESIVWFTKTGDETPYTGNPNLGFGAHKYKIVKQGAVMKVWVDDVLGLTRTVPAGAVVGIDVYQHTSNGKYRNFSLKPL